MRLKSTEQLQTTEGACFLRQFLRISWRYLKRNLWLTKDRNRKCLIRFLWWIRLCRIKICYRTGRLLGQPSQLKVWTKRWGTLIFHRCLWTICLIKRDSRDTMLNWRLNEWLLERFKTIWRGSNCRRSWNCEMKMQLNCLKRIRKKCRILNLN